MLIPRPTLSTSIWGAPGTSLSLAHQDRAQKGGHLFFACLWRTFHMESLRTGVALDMSADAQGPGVRRRLCERAVSTLSGPSRLAL